MKVIGEVDLDLLAQTIAPSIAKKIIEDKKESRPLRAATKKHYVESIPQRGNQVYEQGQN